MTYREFRAQLLGPSASSVSGSTHRPDTDNADLVKQSDCPSSCGPTLYQKIAKVSPQEFKQPRLDAQDFDLAQNVSVISMDLYKHQIY